MPVTGILDTRPDKIRMSHIRGLLHTDQAFIDITFSLGAPRVQEFARDVKSTTNNLQAKPGDRFKSASDDSRPFLYFLKAA